MSNVDFVVDGFVGHPITETTFVLSCQRGGPVEVLERALATARHHRIGVVNWGMVADGDMALTFRSAADHTLFCLMAAADVTADND